MTAVDSVTAPATAAIPDRRAAITALVLIVGAGSVLRLVSLDDKSFWIDELLTVCHADSIVDVWTVFTPVCGNLHPPLYFLLVRLWSFWGTGEGYLRLVSALAGVAAIPVAYLLGRELLGRHTGLITSALVAVSPFLVLHDRELRMYPLLTTLSLASVVFLLRAVRDERPRDWTLFAIATTLNLYVHYHAVLVAFAECVLLLIWRRRLRAPRRPIVAIAAIAVAFLFWMPSFVSQISNPAAFNLNAPSRFPVVSGAAVAPLGYLFYALSLGQTLLPWRPLAIAGLLAFTILFLLGIMHLRRRRDAFVAISVLALVPVVVGFTVSETMPRYYIFLAPIAYLVVVEGWLSLRNVAWRTTLATVALLPMALSLHNYYQARDFHVLALVDPWREVGQYLGAGMRADDCVVTIGSYRPIAFYTADLAGFHRPIYDNDIQGGAACLAEDRRRTLWVVAADPSLAERLADAVRTLDSGFQRSSERRFLNDPEYRMKERLFRRRFLEYRITVISYVTRATGAAATAPDHLVAPSWLLR